MSRFRFECREAKGSAECVSHLSDVGVSKKKWLDPGQEIGLLGFLSVFLFHGPQRISHARYIVDFEVLEILWMDTNHLALVGALLHSPTVCLWDRPLDVFKLAGAQQGMRE